MYFGYCLSEDDINSWSYDAGETIIYHVTMSIRLSLARPIPITILDFYDKGLLQYWKTSGFISLRYVLLFVANCIHLFATSDSDPGLHSAKRTGDCYVKDSLMNRFISVKASARVIHKESCRKSNSKPLRLPHGNPWINATWWFHDMKGFSHYWPFVR